MSKINGPLDWPNIPLPDPDAFDGIDGLEGLASDVSSLPDLNQIIDGEAQTLPGALESLANSRMDEMNLGAQLLQNNLNNFLPELPDSYRFGENNSSEYSKTFGDPGAFGSGHLKAYGSEGTTLLSGETGLHFGDIDQRAQGELGSAYFKGGVFVGARGRVFGDVDWANRSAKFGFEAEIGARAHYEGGFSTPNNAPAGVDGGFRGDAFAGARASGEAEISMNENSPRVAVGGEVFEGARAGIEAGTGVSIGGERLVGAHYGVEGWTGVGAAASADIGFKDGKFQFNFFGGLALGIGGKISWGFEVDFGAIAKLPGKFLGELGSAAKSVAGEVVKGLSTAGNAVVNTVKDVGNKAVETVKNIGEKAVDTVKDIGKGVSNFVSSIF